MTGNGGVGPGGQGSAYTAAERRTIAAALDGGAAAACPACGEPLSVRAVAPTPGVAYVRRRVWVLCPSCRRTASVDVKRS